MQHAALAGQRRQLGRRPGAVGAAAGVERITIRLRRALDEREGGRRVAANDEARVDAVCEHVAQQLVAEQVGRELRDVAGRVAEAHAGDRGVQGPATFVALERERPGARQVDQRFAGNGHLHQRASRVSTPASARKSRSAARVAS
jgi:hypothetical protein